MVVVKSQSVVINAKSFFKNSSLITFGFNLLTDNMLWCDELNFQLITSVICSKKMLMFPDSG
jgi:hypothetical protein